MLLSRRTQAKRRGKPWTMDLWRERTATVRKDCTHRRNAIISIGEGEELKSTSSEEKNPLEWVTTCTRRVQLRLVFVLNFWAVLPRYKYLNVLKIQSLPVGKFRHLFRWISNSFTFKFAPFIEIHFLILLLKNFRNFLTILLTEKDFIVHYWKLWYNLSQELVRSSIITIS